MWQDKAIARLGHACGCSLRTILGHQLARIFLADGHFVCFYPLIHTASVCHQNVTRHFRFFCLSSCSCNIHQIQLKYLLASTEESVKHHLYTPNRSNRGMWLLSSVGYNFRSVSAFIGCYSCGLHRPWGNTTLLPQSGFTLLRWVLASDSSRRTQVVLGTDTAVEVKSPLYNPACGYRWKKGQWPPLRAEYLPSSTREPYQIRGSLSSSPSVWSSTFHPRTPDLARYCLGRWMLRQSTCFAFDFWLSCASPSENGVLSWEAFFLGKKHFILPFCKDHSWWARPSNMFFCFWGMRKLPF